VEDGNKKRDRTRVVQNHLPQGLGLLVEGVSTLVADPAKHQPGGLCRILGLCRRDYRREPFAPLVEQQLALRDVRQQRRKRGLR
jgi:hypothetical protein